MADTRIYRVDEKDAHGKPVTNYLVRAASVAQAVRHVAEPRFTAGVASQDDLVELAGKGHKVQDANGGAGK